MSVKDIRVLLIDGNPNNMRLIAELLAETKKGELCFEYAGCLSLGIERLKQGGIDLVLLNLRLPDCLGVAAFDKIKAEFLQIPVIILSAPDEETVAAKTVLAGAQDYLLEGQLNAGLLLRSIRYAFERKQTEKEIRRTNRLIKMVSECNRILVHTKNELDLLRNLCRIIVETGGYCFVWVGYVKHDKNKSVCPVAYAGHEAGYLNTVNISWADKDSGQGHTGRAIRTACPCISENFAEAAVYCPWQVEARKRGYASSIALPLIADKRVFGALNIYAATISAFDKEEINLLMELAHNLSYGIMALRTGKKCKRNEKELKKIFCRLRRVSNETVDALASTFEKRDPYTAGHQKRVVQLASAIAREMNFSAEQIEGVRIAGTLHDIGKIHVPAEILSKPSQLNETELDFIKTHPQVGYDILKGIEFAWPVAQIILSHHERMDGSGYPFGLSGRNILPEARIIAVADVIEAISSHRPYRPALGIDKALAEVSQNTGTLYDPVAARAALKLFKDKAFKFTC